MKKPLLLPILISLSFITVLAQQQAATKIEPDNWVKVAPAKAGFAVLLPAKPSEFSQPVEGRPELENHFLTLDTELGSYVISYVQFAEEITDPEGIKALLDRGRSGVTAKVGGELISETEIKLAGYSGREWNVKLPKGLSATARAYWVKRRLYQTVFVKSPKEDDSAELKKLRRQAETKFLDSFSLTNDASQ